MQVKIDLCGKKVSSFNVVVDMVSSITSKLPSGSRTPLILTLDMSQNNLSSQQLQPLSHLTPPHYPTYIKSFILHNNLLTNLSFISQKTSPLFQQIQQFYFQHNRLDDIAGLKCIRTTKLERLTMGSNHLTDQQMALIKGIDLSQVKVLEVQKNRLQKVDWLKEVNTPKLLMLSLNENNIKEIDLTSTVFLKSLYILNLSANSLINSSIGVCTFSNLRQLNLSKNHISSGEGITFLDLNQNLSTLKLNDNLIYKSRFLALINCRNLTDLELRRVYHNIYIDRNRMTQINSQSLRRGNFKKVTTLKLQNNELSGAYTNELLLSLSRQEVVALSLWGKKNVQTTITSYQRMKGHFRKMTFYNY